MSYHISRSRRLFKFAKNRGARIKPLVQYLSAARAELTKVVWPTRRQGVRLTLLVIAFSLFFAAVLGALDYVFSTALQKLILKG